uniref:Uncharacterized protein n=1 Tax=Rhizophora mucronata TaxID=61149 RepID=A0A2P2NGJ8_RHIMU
MGGKQISMAISLLTPHLLSNQTKRQVKNKLQSDALHTFY